MILSKRLTPASADFAPLRFTKRMVRIVGRMTGLKGL